MSKIFAVYRKNNRYYITSYVGDVVTPDMKYLYQNIEKRECERYLELKGWHLSEEVTQQSALKKIKKKKKSKSKSK